jgi:hypothetical protein
MSIRVCPGGSSGCSERRVTQLFDEQMRQMMSALRQNSRSLGMDLVAAGLLHGIELQIERLFPVESRAQPISKFSSSQNLAMNVSSTPLIVAGRRGLGRWRFDR